MSLQGDSSSLNELQLEFKTFSERNDIKPWLFDKLLQTRGIRIGIERSDQKKIVFKCKRKDKGKPCTFRIRANYSIKSKSWSLVIINSNHNHGSNLDVNEIDEEEFKKVVDLVSKLIDTIINDKIIMKDRFSEQEKTNLIELISGKFFANHSKYLSNGFLKQLNPVSSSPLLNDVDTSTSSIDNLIHLPDTSTTNNLDNNHTNNININNLINTDHHLYHINADSIQNQNNQLPSFNSIQIPLSPNLPSLNNATLNPSHLLKSSSLYLNNGNSNSNNYNFQLDNLNVLGGPIKGDLKNNNLDNNW